MDANIKSQDTRTSSPTEATVNLDPVLIKACIPPAPSVQPTSLHSQRVDIGCIYADVSPIPTSEQLAFSLPHPARIQ
ncbi:uncharacterized protein DFL_009259 [Arthrobotrys flagrans]|uniref:Uncharacterized protein n=1 Tax=Arthrobotrys flagrans TaxID=97331 RepID=A0A436ZRF6_ARTFL|nr:hypothetical protein DFL_009259 [Arthrobotrys flagrans]